MSHSLKLSVVIPVFNERATIEEVVPRVRAVAIEEEILIVEDGLAYRTRGVLWTLRPRRWRRPSCVRG
jgi:glycosyltransferase involved in cell wall biosynthesis